MNVKCTIKCNNCGNPNIFIKYIKRIIKIARLLNIKDIVIDPNLTVLGRIVFDHKIIYLRNDCLRIMLMTLCHEVGHWVAYKLHINRKCKTKQQREIAADLFGFVISTITIPQSIINYRMWKVFAK